MISINKVQIKQNVFLENIVSVLWFEHGGAVGWGTALQVRRSHDVIVIFHWHNPFCRTMALGLTQPLREMSTRNTSWGVKASTAWVWQPCHVPVPTVLQSGSLNFLEASGPVESCLGIGLPLLWFGHMFLTTWIPIKLLVFIRNI